MLLLLLLLIFMMLLLVPVVLGSTETHFILYPLIKLGKLNKKRFNQFINFLLKYIMNTTGMNESLSSI